MKIPDHIADCFIARGVDPAGIQRYAKGDMNLDRAYEDHVFAFDDEKFYVISGLERVELASRSEKLKVLFDVRDFSERPISELGHLDVDQMMTTARLVSRNGEKGEYEELALFSLGKTNTFEIFSKHFNKFTNKEEKEDDGHIGEEQEIFCPKCGTRYPEPNRKICPKCLSKASIALRLFSLFKRYKKQILAIVLFMLAGTAISIIAPYFSKKLLFDYVLADPARVAAGEVDTVYYGVDLFQRVLLVVVVIFGFSILSRVLGVFQQRYIAGVMPRVIYDMKMLIFGSMQRLSVGFYTSKQTGSLMWRVTGDANNVYNFFIGGIPYLISSIFTIVGALIVMFSVSWQLTLIILAAIPVIVLGYWLIMHFFQGMYHANWVHSSRMNSLLSDALYGQRIIKAFTQEDSESDRFSKYSGNVADANIKLGVAQNTVYPIVGFVMTVANIVLLAVGAYMIINGTSSGHRLTYGDYILFASYVGMIIAPLNFYVNIANWWASCIDSAQRIFEIIDAKSDLVESENPVHMADIKGDFVAEEVMFEYEPGRPVVRNLSISVKAGQMLGIVGKTGAGKSTLVNLLARLYDPNEGTITLDGVNLKDIETADLRKNIGIVSQDIYLFIGSIADNIRYARPEASMEEVVSAAKKAWAHDFIAKFPDGYDTRVGAGGQSLSGGELQRVSIARAIIQNPSVLVLDEATAAMDTETERNIQNSLSELQQGRTTIAIAHRLSTLRDADVLAVIDDGRVVEYGTHEELLAMEDGTYHRLYTLQMEALKFIGIG